MMFIFMLQVYSDADLKSYKRDVVTKERKLRAGADYPCDCYFNIGLHVYSDPNLKSYNLLFCFATNSLEQAHKKR